MSKPSLFAVITFAFAVFLVGAILYDIEFSARVLLMVYATVLAFGWIIDHVIARRSLPKQSPAVNGDAHVDLQTPRAFRNGMSTVFFITAIFLLAVTAISTLADQSAIAMRVANWAYGFLGLGIAGVTLSIIAFPARIRILLERFTNLGFILLLFVAAYYVTEGVYPAAERQFIVDVYPKQIADRATNNDLLINTNPSFKLSSIPKLPPHVDVNPDVRGAALWDDLMLAAKDKSHLFWISAKNDSTDTQNFLMAFLKTNACLIDVPDASLPVRVYEWRSPLVRPTNEFALMQADWGAIQLTGAQISSRVCSGDSLAVTVRWQMPQPREDLRLSLSLVDAQARRIQSQDFPIAGATTSHALVVPFGTPPGTYTIQAAIYSTNDGQRLRVQGVDHINLGQTTIERANDVSADPFNSKQDASLSPARVELRNGVMLDAYGVSALDIIPGESLGIMARWRALRESLPDYSMRVRLMRGEQIIVRLSGKPVDSAYPTTQWRKDESVIERWDVRVPAETTGGTARLEIGIEGGKMVYVADVNIATITRTMQVPAMMQSTRALFGNVGELLGYDLNRTKMTADDSLDVTMYWRGVASVEKDYRVFAQLVANDGHLIAQSDAVPANGVRPTRSWVNGEIIADKHSLRVVDKTYQGDATLIVGLYDPVLLARVALSGGGDFVSLPTRVQIVK
jgi:hypothetical protein